MLTAPPPRARSASLAYEARRALGGLLPLIDDPGMQDLLVQVAGDVSRLWVDRGSGGLEQIEGWRAPAEWAQRFAVALIAAGGRHIDERNPCADVHLGGGIRVHAALSPIAVEGAAVSIRLPRPQPLSLEDLVSSGTCSPGLAAELRGAVLRRQNLLITGGTATGKTTLLAALLDVAPPEQRIITIEDVAELRLSHPHRVALEARQANAEGVGQVTLEQLLREALRMRPDRIVLGECRGAELVTMLSALNTGHDGGAATMHASRLEAVPARLEALGALAGLSPAATARQAASAVHVVVHLERAASGARRVAALGRLRLVGDELAIDRMR